MYRAAHGVTRGLQKASSFLCSWRSRSKYHTQLRRPKNRRSLTWRKLFFGSFIPLRKYSTKIFGYWFPAEASTEKTKFMNEQNPDAYSENKNNSQQQSTSSKGPKGFIPLRSLKREPKEPVSKWRRLFQLLFFGVVVWLVATALRNMWNPNFKWNAKSSSKEPKVLKPWQMAVLKKFPTRIGSRLWGRLTNLYVPRRLRKAIYGFYAQIFHCNLDEMELPLDQYPTLAAFFARRLKPGARPIDPDSGHLFSPVDGRVLHYGLVKGDILEQIKGIKYSLKEFMGENSLLEPRLSYLPNREQFHEFWPTDRKRLYYCVFYLAPGDYHGVHAPTDFLVQQARHFPGYLFSVSKLATRWIKNLFCLNERVSLNGEWKYGFFSLTSVGAYNVGSIKITFDPEIKTNQRKLKAGSHFIERSYTSREQGGVLSKLGEEIAFFNLGSSVVLLFESPEFLFVVNKGQKVPRAFLTLAFEMRFHCPLYEVHRENRIL